MRFTALAYAFCLGLNAFANTEFKESPEVCEKWFLEECKRDLVTFKLKRDVILFHWFQAGHAGQGHSDEDYIRKTAQTFGEGDRGYGGTGGLYLATDPSVTCNYGGEERADVRLAMLRYPAGTRIGFMRRIEALSENPVKKGCPRFYHYWPQSSKKCLEAKGVTLSAYIYQENTSEERNLFGNTIAFTATTNLSGGKEAKLEILSGEEIRAANSFSARLVSRRIVTQGRDICYGPWKLKNIESTDLEKKLFEKWMKTYWLSHSGSKEFFELESSTSITYQIEMSSVGGGHGQ